MLFSRRRDRTAIYRIVCLFCDFATHILRAGPLDRGALPISRTCAVAMRSLLLGLQAISVLLSKFGQCSENGLDSSEHYRKNDPGLLSAIAGCGRIPIISSARR